VVITALSRQYSHEHPGSYHHTSTIIVILITTCSPWFRGRSPFLIRTVPLRIPACRFVRLLVHEPFLHTKLNPHHQMALQSLTAYGWDALHPHPER
jgi:hypothetical protein